MNLNTAKLVVVAVLALALIVIMAINSDNVEWAGGLLALLVGYVIGNARVSDNTPIISNREN